MSIHFDENMLAIWFMTLEPGRQDWMAAMSREGERFKLVYRFRYHQQGVDDTDPFKTKDEKSWYSAISAPGQTKDAMIEGTRGIVKKMEEMSGQRCDELIRGESESLDDFMDRMLGYEWAHVKIRHPKRKR